MPQTVTTIDERFATGKPRRIKVTCRYCGHTHETWTRRGLRFTCRNPECRRQQEGPAAIQKLIDRAQHRKGAPMVSIAPARVITVQPVKAAAKPPAKPAPLPAAASPVPPKPSPPPSEPKLGLGDIIGKAMGFS